MEVDTSDIKRLFSEAMSKMDALLHQIQCQRDRIAREMEEKITQLQLGRFDSSQLEEFFKEPYLVIPKRENEFYVVVPRWINFQIGYLERQTRSYNIFVINQYVQWISQIPNELKRKLKLPDPLPWKVYDGMLLTGEADQEKAWNKFRHHLSKREGKDRIKIKHGHEFKLIVDLIKNGTVPFMKRPISDSDLREWRGIELRSYQRDAWNIFQECGACGIFWPFGSGKSFFGIYVLARIKGKKLVVVPTLTLKEQWHERIRKYIPMFEDEIDVVTYHAYEKLVNDEFTLIIFDECQHLPANSFIRLSTLRTKYRLGFSGSPFREDQRESYIFALTGFPVGMAWDELLKLQVVKAPVFKLYLVPDARAKINKLRELLKLPLKTIIFCDSIDLGERISKIFEIPFIYGGTRERLDVIRKADVCVVSRVGDEGINVPELERVIEVSFLFGSRMQESQRFGRLMHSQREEPEHIIIMTEKEFDL